MSPSQTSDKAHCGWGSWGRPEAQRQWGRPQARRQCFPLGRRRWGCDRSTLEPPIRAARGRNYLPELSPFPSPSAVLAAAGNSFVFHGAPGETRTPDLLVRSSALSRPSCPASFILCNLWAPEMLIITRSSTHFRPVGCQRGCRLAVWMKLPRHLGIGEQIIVNRFCCYTVFRRYGAVWAPFRRSNGGFRRVELR
jgi:hypothetical protein